MWTACVPCSSVVRMGDGSGTRGGSGQEATEGGADAAARPPGVGEDATPAIDGPTCEADTHSPPMGIARVPTFESFGVHDFRYFWMGAFISNVGTWMQIVALGWLVYEITRSSFSLGLVSFISGIPVLLFILFAGAAADRFERRKLLIWLQVAMMVQAAAFGLLTQFDIITLPWIYALTFAGGLATAFMFPAWQAMVPDLVPRRLLLNAIALNSAQFNGARLLGPMIGALIFARWGVAEVFYANAVTFLFVIWSLAVIRPCQTMPEGPAPRPLEALGGGLRYAWEHRAIGLLLLTMAMVTVFGMPFTTLMPVIAAQTLGVGKAGYSTLMAANGFGALVGALVVASLPRETKRDRIIRFSVLAFAALLLGLSLSRSYWLSMALLVGMGFAFLAAVSSINTSLQSAAPPELRGRILSLFVLTFMGIMPFGSLGFGALGRQIGAAGALTTGALVLLAHSLLLLARLRLLAPPSAAQLRHP